jgi:hypothetical protein
MFIMVYKFIGKLIISLLGVALWIAAMLFTLLIELWIFHYSVTIPLGHTTESFIGGLFTFIVVIPTQLLLFSSFIHITEKVDKFLDKDF